MSHEHGKWNENLVKAIWMRQSGKAPGSGSREKVAASAVKIFTWGRGKACWRWLHWDHQEKDAQGQLLHPFERF